MLLMPHQSAVLSEVGSRATDMQLPAQAASHNARKNSQQAACALQDIVAAVPCTPEV